jgi:hypothetical protein
MNLTCVFGHAETIRDRDASGAQCLRCLNCWKVLPYPETDVSALRAEQQRQREAIKLKGTWKQAIARPAVLAFTRSGER